MVYWAGGNAVGHWTYQYRDTNHPDDDLLGKPAHGHGGGNLVGVLAPVATVIMTFIGRFLLSVSMNEFIDRAAGLPAWESELMDVALSVRGLRAYYMMSYFGIEREVRAVDDTTLSVLKKEIYGIAGESSCGKSTFIRTIAAAIRPPLRVLGGSIKYSFLDRDLYDLDERALAGIRWKHLSCILQGSMNVLNPVRRVRESFKDFAFPHMGLARLGFFDVVNQHLERLHLSPSVLSAFPHELSGGMRQRVAIVLATVCRPEFIIADEPTTALDVVVRKDVLALILETKREIGSSMIFVTHDLTVHANISNRLGIMYAGRLLEEGPTRDILHDPMHPTPSIWSPACRGSATLHRRRRCRELRRVWPRRHQGAASTRAVRWRWIFATKPIPC